MRRLKLTIFFLLYCIIPKYSAAKSSYDVTNEEFSYEYNTTVSNVALFIK